MLPLYGFDMFFSSISNVLRIAATAILLYFILIVILRISGKRTLASMNAFDFIVTVALGTTLASTILDSNIALTDGLTALVVLIVLQFLISCVETRSKRFSHLIKAEPKLLCYKGILLHDSMRKERVAKSEILQALRQNGYSSIEDAFAVVLETNGNFSVLSKPNQESSSLQDVN